jgi:hypothetical protein
MMQFTYNNNIFIQNRPIIIGNGKSDRQNLNQLTKSVTVQKEILIKPNENKMTWGEPIWFLFHTLAQKVKEESFPIIRLELLNSIYSICSNLPCPICTNHAVEYLDKINFNTINSKDQMIQMLYLFHNEVNKRKNLDLFNFDDLKTKYSKAITINIIQNFMIHYDVKSKNMRMIANDFHKKRLVSNLKAWFNANIIHFES